MDIRRLILILRRQLWVLLALVLAFLALFVMLPNLGKDKSYVSRAKVLLTPPKATTSNDMYRDPNRDNWLADEATLRELLSSERLLSRVRSSASIKDSWQELREKIGFEPITADYQRKVSLFMLSFSDPDPKQAQKLAELALNEFVSYVEELSAREFSGTRRFLEELVAESKDRVDSTEEKLLAITTKRADSKQSERLSENIMQLEGERRKVREELALLEAELSTVQSYVAGGISLAPSSSQGKVDSTLTQLETAVATAKLKLLELEQLYTEDNVQVVEQRAKLRKTEQMYNTRLADYAAAVSEDKGSIITQKRKTLQGLDERIREIRNSQLTATEKREVAKLERQLTMWEDNHLNLVKQLYQARVVEQGSRRQGAISILEQPSPGVLAKDKKQKSMVARLGFGLPISCALAVAVVIGLDTLGSSLRLVPKIEESLGVPVLAMIPALSEELAENWEAYKRVETLPKKYTSLLAHNVEGSAGTNPSASKVEV